MSTKYNTNVHEFRQHKSAYVTLQFYMYVRLPIIFGILFNLLHPSKEFSIFPF